MTKDGSSRFGSDSSKRRKSGDLNDRFDGMIRRTQRFRSGTGSSRNPASSSSKRKSAKKRPAPDPGCLRSKGIQDIRGDCVGREFAVLKRQGQEVLQTDDPDETGPDQAEQVSPSCPFSLPILLHIISSPHRLEIGRIFRHGS